MELIKSILGNIELIGETGNWKISAVSEIPEPGLELIHLDFSAPKAEVPPHVTLKWSTPQIDMQIRWFPAGQFGRNIPPDFTAMIPSNLASSIPIMQLINFKDENRVLFAVSDAMRKINLMGGVCEKTNEITFKAELFSVPEAPLSSCKVTLRLDTRKMFYADSIRAAMEWFCTFPEYAPVPPPKAAFEPIYSTWYSYHQNVSDDAIRKECELAKEYGMKGVILDDGWQTDDVKGGYGFCGDWDASGEKFPNMRAHVESVHKLGMKYVVWFAVPFVGEKSKNFNRFKSKYLYSRPTLETWVLDPRFPEVREFLIETYEKAVKEWDIDGFKLDFIDSFRFEGEDPAVKENYAGRDIQSLPHAVDKLLSDVMARLRKLKPDILIEFRQSYIGPAIRKYGNMFRAGDCAAATITNRNRTIDLRLTSGDTAVHSDMLEWHYADSAENAALQLLNILFSVPQISVRLAEIPESHRRMLRFWLDFCIRHKDVLQNGYLKPYHPDNNYPIVSAENKTEKVIAVYRADMAAEADCEPGKTCYVVNATGYEYVILDFKRKPVSAEYFDTMGNSVKGIVPEAGISRVSIPASGLLKLQF